MSLRKKPGLQANQLYSLIVNLYSGRFLFWQSRGSCLCFARYKHNDRVGRSSFHICRHNPSTPPATGGPSESIPILHEPFRNTPGSSRRHIDIPGKHHSQGSELHPGLISDLPLQPSSCPDCLAAGRASQGKIYLMVPCLC
jgi:hypothetical protein